MPSDIKEFHEFVVGKTGQKSVDTEFSLANAWPPAYGYYKLVDVEDGFNSEVVLVLDFLVGASHFSFFRSDLPRQSLMRLVGKDVKVWFDSRWRVIQVEEEPPRK